MSEYQRYEFMTVDRSLTQKQMDKVNRLSSHIAVTSTHAVVEYNYGDFKHDPIEVLHEFFDGYMYWANWGSPELALRFPHGALPADLLKDYDFDDFVTFTQHPDYDILHVSMSEMEGLDEWIDYDLGSIIGVREDLLQGDLRPLYIIWLACQQMIRGFDDDDDGGVGEVDESRGVMPIPPGLGHITAAQSTLGEFLQVSSEFIDAAARHSRPLTPTSDDKFAAWVELLPIERRNEYLVRMANGEPGVSRALVQELREVGGKKQPRAARGEHVPYPILVAEGRKLEAIRERKQREEDEQARARHLQYVHEHQSEYWSEIEREAAHQTGPGYDEALNLLLDLRAACEHFDESEEFEGGFRAWVRGQTRRPALLKRLRANKFPLPPA